MLICTYVLCAIDYTTHKYMLYMLNYQETIPMVSDEGRKPEPRGPRTQLDSKHEQQEALGFSQHLKT